VDDHLIEHRVRVALDELAQPYEIMPCDPALADTAAFCAHYGVAPDRSANCIVVVGKGQERIYVACLVLATTRLDVNGLVRRRLGVKKASFATAEETIACTGGMQIGGVTPFGLPADLPVWIDARVAACPDVIVGGGSRACKVRVAPAVLTALPTAELVDDLALALDPT
jgi:prolyl-tRNA editing enzyme YbaK/EbsC (Cys-tRNA(Pro) deacylase)